MARNVFAQRVFQTFVGLALMSLLLAWSAPTRVAAQVRGGARPAKPGAQSGGQNPFARRVDVPEFPAGMEWVNTLEPVKLADLRGKFVILDFWTYCCINCIHVLPELKKLEHAYPNQLVVIGVHSAKFDTEQDTQNIHAAVRRYEIEHPVVNDHQHQIWRTFGVRSWPTVLLIDPEGKAVYGQGGEFTFEQFDAIFKRAMPYYRQHGLLDETRQVVQPVRASRTDTPLRFPGKVFADAASDRLFISDSNHNRIVVTNLAGAVQEIIGSGTIGRQDGTYAESTFHHPQGMALHQNQLYVCDTENHLLRKIDLTAKRVTTIAGIGRQARNAWPQNRSLRKKTVGDVTPWIGTPLKTALNSPWAIWPHRGFLYIAMAGPHQIWRMDLAGTHVGPYAGNGREDIVDGPRLPREPFALGASSFAQPSGLTADENWLYVADSEGSSIRAVPLDPRRAVRTVVGTADRPDGRRLFTFGDQDGPPQTALLQHALGVTYHDGSLYVADTYNDKIKQVKTATGAVTTLKLSADPPLPEGTGLFDEPAGIAYAAGQLFVADTNQHQIQVIDLRDGSVRPLPLEGLRPPAADEKSN